DVPREAVAEVQRALESGREVVGVDILGKDARPDLYRAASDAEVCGCIESEAERVVRVVGRDGDRISETASSRRGADEDRLRRRLVRGLTVVEQPLEVQLYVLADVIGQVREDRLAFGRRR